MNFETIQYQVMIPADLKLEDRKAMEYKQVDEAVRKLARGLLDADCIMVEKEYDVLRRCDLYSYSVKVVVK